MKWIVPTVVFFAATMACAETVTTTTTTEGVEERRTPDLCRTTANPYARESCEEIRQSDRVRNNPNDEHNVTTVIQKKTVEPSTSKPPMPAWQKALQPPAPSNTPQDIDSTTTTIIQNGPTQPPTPVIQNNTTDSSPANNNTMPSWQKALQ